MIINCNIPLMRRVEYAKWILETCSKWSSEGGAPLYVPRKSLREEYAILDGVRHIGPRRRAELDALTREPPGEKEAHAEFWMGIIERMNMEEEE